MPDPRDLWTSQPAPARTFDPAILRQRLERQRRRLDRRNLAEYLAGAFVIAAFLAFAIIGSEPVRRAGALLTVAGTVFALWQLRRRATPEPTPESGDLVAFQRAELTRQIAALESVALWYLAPFVPGFVVFTIGDMRADGQIAPGLFTLAAGAAVFGVIWRLNLRAAAELRRERDALEQ